MRRTTGLVVGLSALLVAASAGGAGATADVTTTRVSGADRYETAATIAKQTDVHDEFVLASGENFPDALASPVLGAPIVLTTRDHLPAATREAINGSTRVTVVGGPAAVSEEVMNELRSMDILYVRRLAGDDRYETARIVAEEREAGYFVDKRTAILATGADFADALAAGPLSYQNRYPILLTGRDSLHPSAEQALDQLEIKLVLIAGGTAAVGQAVEDRLKEKGIDVVRVAGEDRADTAAKGAELVSQFQKMHAVYLVTGRTFADALAAAPLAGQQGALFGPILIADGWPTPSSQYVQRHASDISSITAVGGTTAVADDALAAACRDAGGSSC